ncbi:hypothetical protein A9Q84_15130 [Halobacteriovorax marinus]|uniref:Metal-dependent hydrolase n=1 Tax=Halobacteriovorax marinus TaxID=97084 RepID=A0A1Y5F5A1_9BACT|nr:hypothetical protein A9Q84_15130 [Halobacteriovorax marinus]
MAFTTAAAKLGENHLAKTQRFSMLRLACWLSILPDLDVVAFTMGIAYSDQFGHRGFTHSLSFALVVSLVTYFICKWWYKRKSLETSRWLLVLFFIAITSHALLDMLTNGGLGCALFWPFDHTRYFFPTTPIPVSPIGLSHSLYNVLAWEFVLVLPLTGIAYSIKSKYSRNKKIALVIFFALVCGSSLLRRLYF